MVLQGDIHSIILAVVLGAAIGLEREVRGKAAGLRTNVLICLGAAVFTIISERMGGTEGDSLTRIAAGVVAGIGFLGAGAIIRERASVVGLTTAATIWLVASVGMACGAKLYTLAVVSALIAIVVLIGFGRLEKPLGHLGKKNRSKNIADKQT